MRAVLGVRIALALAVPSAACSDEFEGHDAEIEDADDLFSLDQVAEIRLELSAPALAALNAEPREYVAADLHFPDGSYRQVGLRLKGTFSYQGLGGKAAFKLDFDHFVTGQRVLGLEGLTLNNLRQDHTTMHELLAYTTFRAAGAVAPRAAFAAVWLNGTYYGLYAMVESVNDTFLPEWFADPSGNLYEATLGDDLRLEDLWEFDQDEGSDETREDLEAFITQAQLADDTVFFAADALLDLDPFLAFVAVESIIGHWDGYVRSHNYRLYCEPTLDKWYFIPWGTDMAFDRTVEAFSSQGFLARKCFDSPACLVEYVRVAAEVAERFAELRLDETLAAAIALTADYLFADQRQPFRLDGIERHQAILRDAVDAAPAALLEAVDCVEAGVEVDRDQDGFGDCFADCERASGDAYPGGAEICDGLDNDCNGRVDDSGCPCPTMEVDGAVFHFCDRSETWTNAVNQCRSFGARMAWFDDAVQNHEVWTRSQAIRPGRWTIGLNDRAAENVYRWQGGDDVPAALEIWAAGEPEDFGGQDCVGYAVRGDAGWEDVQCNFAHPFICRDGEP